MEDFGQWQKIRNIAILRIQKMKEIPEKLNKPYNPNEAEPRIYEAWEKSGFFNPEKSIEAGLTPKDAKSFTIMMPPPNVTGVLHMGHGLATTLQDIMIRYKRMRGFRTLWLPGTDHAAIATQSKVEKEILKKEGKSRHDLGREEMLKRVNAFAQESHDTIVSQIKRLGASCDWTREAFTLDATRNLAVNTMFKKMYDDGLIYRGNRVINWDPKGQTTISDDEIVYEERDAKLYTFKYSADFPISISTTRPETKVGDTAVAVHPDDTRYKEFIGKEYDLEFCGVKIHIKIIADESVEKDFGTGALGVTPAHSQIDAEIAERHNLPMVQVINEYAKMMVGDENLMGKKTTEAREVVVTWLKENNLLEKEEPIKQRVSTAERTGGIVEPLPKLQWFVDVNKIIPGRGKSLKQLTKEPVESGQIKLTPQYFDKTYFHWIDNLRDWCISRQIWYGHRIPVWYKGEEIFIGDTAPSGDGWKQDEDTLDTWFSSGMWTFSTLGWPENTEDFKIYHPTDVLETGYDILFFWVARMIMMTQYALDDIPFKNVYLHGLVRDGKGKKMSKSLGNALDPIEIAEKYGADAGRIALVIGTAPGTDSKIDENKIKGYKHFANKLWNVARFIEMYSSDEMGEITEVEDKKLIEEFNTFAKDITSDMENMSFHTASEKIYGFAWRRFADVILEESKTKLTSENKIEKLSREKTLREIFKGILILLHPFMPFVTEELWGTMKLSDRSLMTENWVTYE